MLKQLKMHHIMLKKFSNCFDASHPGLTRVRGIRFLLFEIIRVLVFNETFFKLTGLFVLYFSFKLNMPAKKVF